MLTVASLLSILFVTFHLTDDLVRGMEKGGASNQDLGAHFQHRLYRASAIAPGRSSSRKFSRKV
jgi:hypothetical protein